MNYKEKLKNPKSFLSLTGLYPEEFKALLEFFELEWIKFYKYYTLERKKRKHRNPKPYKDTKTLATIGDKLFFILVYLKTAPLQEFQAACFDMSQAKVSSWVKILLPLLVASLKAIEVLPARTLTDLQKLIDKNQTKVFNLDATERLIERDTDYENQKEQYSGKKGDHTIKNNVVCDDNQTILFLGDTYTGPTQDKKMADKDQLSFPKNAIVRLDLGYLGLFPSDAEQRDFTLVIPFKKPKGGSLSKAQKAYNKVVSQARVVVEHAIGGCKRLRIVKDRLRHIRRSFHDCLLLVAVGLHNFRVLSPFRNYAKDKPLSKFAQARANIIFNS